MADNILTFDLYNLSDETIICIFDHRYIITLTGLEKEVGAHGIRVLVTFGKSY